ncbi:putative pectinesterase/pectinesterase inhibitor 51 [Silene latifolia]|uniref:putative pectinesterase/pectinesterase inhibitor 51 n=1 Tax=Silene latifolia TaxID=37657 RepID=UPI003D773DC0
MVSATGTIKDESNVTDVINAAFTVMTKTMKTGLEKLTHIPDSPNNTARTETVALCKDYISMAMNRSILMNKPISKGAWRDARARASSILSNEYDCASKLTRVNDENSTEVQSTLAFFYTTLIPSTSNVMGLLWARDTYGTDPMMWEEAKTERNQKWDPLVKPLHLQPLFDFADHTPDVTVCKEAGTACFTSVQEAVNVALSNLKKENRFVIRIKEGVYEETVRVPFDKTNLMLIGDGIGKTIITNAVNFPGSTVYECATFSVLGDGFFATNITFQNTAGTAEELQSVAFHSSSEFSYIENCEFLGYHGTLYVHSSRQLYKSCRIEGNVDFIFGNGAAIFQDCTILVRPRMLNPETEETNVIAAHGRNDPAQTTGFVFLGCVISGTDDYLKLYNANPNLHTNYLGRPSEIYSRTVYINCTMEVLINPDGWAPKDGDFGLMTLYYGEFGNSGPGADTSKRVKWSSQIPEEHLSVYSVENFLQGNDWILTDY